MTNHPLTDTASREYTERLHIAQSVWWKRLIPVQAPYRAHLRSLKPGDMLDVGCGLGRNLLHHRKRGIGVDHNAASVAHCRALGLQAYTTAEFEADPTLQARRFDTILLAHVLEHVPAAETAQLVSHYLPRLKPLGRVLVFTPQERGFASDPTHVAPFDFVSGRRLAASLGLELQKQYSFPLPRMAGRWFTHNEFVSIFRLRS